MLFLAILSLCSGQAIQGVVRVFSSTNLISGALPSPGYDYLHQKPTVAGALSTPLNTLFSDDGVMPSPMVDRYPWSLLMTSVPGSVYNYTDSNFLPGGTRAQSYFSWEARFSYAVPASPKPLYFQSGSYLLIFVNGNFDVTSSSLSVSTTPTTKALSLATYAGTTVMITMFYAATNSPINRVFNFQLPAYPGPTVCDTQSSRSSFEIYPLSSSTVNRIRLSDPNSQSGFTQSSTTLRLVQSGALYDAGGVWYPKPIYFQSGFTTRFTFKVSNPNPGNAEGFAFVVVNDAKVLGSVGSSGPALGYNFGNAFAVEFDMNNDGNADLDNNHVELHLASSNGVVAASASQDNGGYTTTTTPTLAGHIAGYLKSKGVNLTDPNGNEVEISYSPTQGLLTVSFLKSTSTNPIVVLSLPLDSTRLANAGLGNSAYFGFTTSTTDTINQASIDITNWRLWTSPPSGAFSTVAATSLMVAANGAQSQPPFVFTAVDGCARPLVQGGDTITATYSPAGSLTSQVSDLGNGQYNFWLWSTKAGFRTVTFYLDGQPLGNPSYPLLVTPGPVSAPQCNFTWVDAGNLYGVGTGNGVPSTVSWSVATNRLFTIRANDQFLNPQPNVPANGFFQLYFGSENPTIAVNLTTPGVFTASVGTNNSYRGTSLYVRYNGVDLQGSPFDNVNIIPGVISPIQSLLEGSFTPFVAGQNGIVRAVPRDQFGNTLQDTSNPVNPLTSTAYTTSVVFKSGAVSGTSSTLVWTPASSLRAHWGFTISATMAGQYALTFSTSGSGAWSTYNVSVTCANPNAAASVLDSTNVFSNVVNMSQVTSFYIQTKDQYSNDRTTAVNPGDTLIVNITALNTNYVLSLDCVAGVRKSLNLLSGSPVFQNAVCQYLSVGRYEIDFNVLYLSSYKVQAYYNGQLVSAASKNFAVAPSRPDPSTSYFACPPTTTAGVVSHCKLTLLDTYGNNATGSPSDFPVFTLLTTGQPRYSIDGVFSTAVGNMLQYTWTPYDAGNFTITVTYSGVAIGTTATGTTTIVTVSPGTINGTMCAVSNLLTTYAQNSTKAFFFNGADSWDNAIPSNSALLAPPASFSATLVRSDGVSSPNPTVVYSSGSQYVVTMQVPFPSANGLQATVTVWVTVSGKATLIVNSTFDISTGLQSYAYIANVTTLITTTIRARGGIQSTFQIWDALNVGLTARSVPQYNDTFAVSVTRTDNAYSYPGIVTVPSSGNIYQAKFTPMIVGTYTLIVQSNGQGIYNQGVQFPTVIVTPGVPSALKSTFVCPNLLVAGDTIVCTLTMRDVAGNMISIPPVPMPVLTFSAMSTAIFTPLGQNGDGTWSYSCKATYVQNTPLSIIMDGTYVSPPTRVQVVPADPDSTTSFIQNYPSSTSTAYAYAGFPYTFCIVLKDRYNNSATLALGLEQNFSVQVELQSPGGFQAVTAAGAQPNCAGYLSSTIITKVKDAQLEPQMRLSMVVKLNFDGTLMTIGTPFPIIGYPGQLSLTTSTFSTLTPQTQTIVQGGTFSFLFNAVDAFNNSLRTGQFGDLALSVVGPSGPVTLGLNVIPLASGVYNITESNVIKAGVYTWQITWQSDSIPETVTPATTTSLPVVTGTAIPGAAYAQNTVFDQISGSFIAGEEALVQATLQDYHNNPIDSITSDTVQAYVLVGSGTTVCTDSTHPNLQTQSNNFLSAPNLAAQNVSGEYTFNVTTDIAGTYSLFALVNGQWAFRLGQTAGCEKIQQSFQVIPAAVDPAMCLLGGPGMVGSVAGYNSSLLITLRDQFGNVLLPSQAQSAVVFVNKSLIVSGPTPTCSGSYNFLDLREQGTVNPNGTVSVRFLFTTAQTFYVAAVVNGQLSGAPGDCPTLTVQPWYVYDFTPMDQASLVVAGEPNDYDIKSVDRYTNIVDSQYSADYYLITLTRTDNLTLERVVGYTFPVESITVANVVNQVVDYIPEWPGSYTADYSLHVDPRYPVSALYPRVADIFSRKYTFNVLPATCVAETLDPTRIYRCPGTRQCVSDPCQCTSSTCCSQSSCFTGTCAADGTCACASNEKLCPGFGHCIPAAATCPTTAFACPTGQIRCGNGVCALASNCPRVNCPRGYTLCPDGQSCAASPSGCAVPVTCPSGQQQCPDGRCVTALENCATQTSCPSGQVLCSDGSCRGSIATCPSVYECYNQVKCPDGTCRASLADCPSHIVCPLNWKKCPNGACNPASDPCTGVSAGNQCQDFEVRCPDGSCRNTTVLCSTVVTCLASAPVRCPDGSCTVDFTLCRPPPACSASGTVLTYQCPDGSCAMDQAHCALTVTCPSLTPVRCPNGDCVATSSSCPASSECLGQVRCRDGSCRYSEADCPSFLVCPSITPIRCPDGSCVPGANMCPWSDKLTCPTGFVRCPGQECAPTYSNCPAVRTCRPGYTRCVDGTCRISCSGLTPFSACPPNTVACPTAQGQICALSITECPTDVVCPVDKSRRCLDQRCGYSEGECPITPVTYDTSVACPDGAFASSISLCSESISCPMSTPVKCWDRTCRVVVEDCPPAPACSDDSPFLCADGNCVNHPNLCQSPTQCLGQAKVKCALGTKSGLQCGNTVSDCYSIFDFTDPVLVGTFAVGSNVCPDGFARCRDGSCKESLSLCKTLTCPWHLSYLCSSGVCARTMAECPSGTDGCPVDSVRCWNGACALAGACPTRPSSPTCQITGRTTEFLCPDGSCTTNSSNCPLATGCPTGQFMCQNRECVDKQVFCSDSTSTHNACPFNRPYKCSSGYCARSSTQCPVLPKETTSSCPQTRPVRCGDGTCVLSSEQCPLIYPCPSVNTNGASLTRCPDGTCRPAAQCPASATSSCPQSRPFSCADGLCAVNANSCFNTTDATNICPTKLMKCPSGLCVTSLSSCTTLSSNGCAAGKTRCVDGSCAAAPCGAPIRCTTAYQCSGTCKDTPAPGCVLSMNGCPVETPVRCADGLCRAGYAQSGIANTCPPIVVCSKRDPYQCADGSCVGSPSLCRPVIPCATGVMCLDGSCASSASACPSVCPPSQSTLCPDGSCRASFYQCGIQNFTKSCSTLGYFKCWDGSCQSSLQACIMRQYLAKGGASSSWDVTKSVDTLCGQNGGALCSDGSCVNNTMLCPPTPACPIGLAVRCPDGSCVNGTRSACAVASITCDPNSGTTLCADGTCRTKCLDYHGCPQLMPYFCPGNYIACSATPCATGNEVCTSGCEKANDAIIQTISVPLEDEITVDVSLDSFNIPRTRLVIPSGAFGVSTTLRIYPVAASAFTSTFYTSMVLSTPFRCSADGVSGQLPLNITVEAAVNTQVYAGATTTGARAAMVPCEYQAPHNLRVDFNDAGAILACQGVVTFTSAGYTILPEIDCAALNRTATLWSLDDPARMQLWNKTVPMEWDGSQSLHCLCWNITGSGTPSLVKTSTCTTIRRMDTSLTLLESSTNHNQCPFPSTATDNAQLPAGVTVSSLTRQVSPDVCKTSSDSVIPYFDMCLGIVSAGGGAGSCLEAYNERIQYPPWNGSVTSAPSYRVTGRITQCNPNTVYAFLHIPLPPPPLPFVHIPTWWELYGKTTIGLIVGLGLFFLISGYVIWRLIRYRRKYLVEKKQLDELNDKAQELDEFAGGLGLADEEVAMVANPLVVQLQELSSQLEKVNRETGADAARDAAEIDTLEKERQRLYAEIQRVKSEMEKAQAQAAKPVRVAEAPPTFDPSNTTGGGAAPAAAISSSSSGGAGGAGGDSQPAIRSDFGQVKKNPIKKKDI